MRRNDAPWPQKTRRPARNGRREACTVWLSETEIQIQAFPVNFKPKASSPRADAFRRSVGRAKVILPNGLEIADIGIFSKDGRVWCQLPVQQVRGADGRPVTDDRGKARYVSSIKWSTRELRDGFSEALIALVRAEHPEATPGGEA